MAEDYGVSLKITADTSDLDKIPQKVEAVSARVAETKAKSEVEVEEQRQPAAPVEHPAETVPVTEQRQPAAPVEHQAETVEVREKRIVDETGGRERPAPAERTETVKVNVEQPEPVTVKVSQDPDPLKIKVELPDPSEIEAAIPKKDFHVDVQPQLDPSKLQAIPPIQVPVEAETPPPVTVEAKAEKVRVEVDDEEAKKRIEALTAKEGIKRIRVVTEGGELATRHGGKEIFELEVDAEAAKKTIADLKADARFKVTADTREAVGSFSILRAATAALHGNVAGLGMEISKLGPKFAAVKTLGVSGIGAILLSLYSVVKLATSLRDLFATLFNVGTVGRDISSIGANLVDIGNKANAFADAMNDARKAADLVNQSLEKEIAALGRVAQAQSEINRQRELSAATSDEERAQVNARYDQQAADIGSSTAQQSADLKRKALTDEIDRIQKELAQSQETEQAYRQQAANARARAEENILLTDDRKQEGKWGVAKAGAEAWGQSIRKFFTHQATSDDKAQAALAVATKAENAADDEVERRAELEERLEKARHDLKIANLEEEARKKQAQAAEEKRQQDEEARKAKIGEKQAQDQNDFTRQQRRTAADAEFEDRMRAEQRKASAPNATEAQRNEAENTQVEMLREREETARKELADAQARLDAELKKPAAERDEKEMSRAREDIRAADTTATDARRRREDLEASAENRRANVAQDYFGNLAQQIEASRPKNRLTAMGLGSDAPGDSRIAAEQANNVKLLVSISKQLLAATRDNKPDNVAVYAP